MRLASWWADATVSSPWSFAGCAPRVQLAGFGSGREGAQEPLAEGYFYSRLAGTRGGAVVKAEPYGRPPAGLDYGFLS